ncbi:MAG: PorT family protein [Bacteroidetes bacterium]|nr:PorT family protein [Bacteroidota bacterium]
MKILKINIILALFFISICQFAKAEEVANKEEEEISKYQLGFQGSLAVDGTFLILSNKNEGKNDNKKLMPVKIHFPCELGVFAGIKFNKIVGFRSFIFWDRSQLEFSNSDYTCHWTTQNLNLSFLFNFHVYKDIPSSYISLGMNIKSILSYDYEAKDTDKVEGRLGLKNSKSIKNIYEKSNDLSKFSFGLILGGGYDFDFGLLIDTSFSIDFNLFKFLGKDKNELNEGKPEDQLYFMTVNAVGSPYLKLRIGYDFGKLIFKN